MKSNLDFDRTGKATVTLIMTKDELSIIDSAMKNIEIPRHMGDMEATKVFRGMVQVVDKARNDLWGAT